MSLVGFAATLVVGATLGIIAIGLVSSGHDCRDTFVCPHCRDTGTHATNERRPRAQFCNMCVLGQNLEVAGRADWGALVNERARGIIPDGAS